MIASPEVPAESAAKVDVVQFGRKWYPGCYSMERVFAAVRSALPNHLSCELVSCRWESRGVLKRILNCVNAFHHRRRVNHITGDVHYLAFLLPPSRTVLTIHDCCGMENPRAWKRELFRWFWLELPIMRSAIVTVISEATRDDVLRYSSCPPQKVRMIPDPVPVGMVAWPKDFNEECPTILQMGTSPRKNFERIVEAVRGMRCSLDIVGRLSASQQRLLDSAGIAHSVSYRLTDLEIANKYRTCDLVTFVSTYEGFGMPIIEANAIGRPVVTSNIRPHRDVAGNAACLVNPYDVQSIRAGVEQVIGDAAYRRRLILEGYTNVERYSSKRIALEYSAVYTEVAEAASHGDWLQRLVKRALPREPLEP